MNNSTQRFVLAVKKILLVVLFSNALFVFAQSPRGGGGYNGGVVSLGMLTDYLFVFTDGSGDANWQGATKGFIGDVLIDGKQAKEKSSGNVPYAGTISTNDGTFKEWQRILDDNPGQATGAIHQSSVVNHAEQDLEDAFQNINAMPVTAGFASRTPQSLDGLNTENGIPEIYVINLTSGFTVNTQINITGDANDVYYFRWDADANFADGYEGKVKFQSGGAIVPHGGLQPTSFIHVAGDLGASGGGNNPAAPYPQGPRTDNGIGALIDGGKDFDGGGFFTGYWLTTGAPTIVPNHGQPYGTTSSLSNAIFVGGWYSKTTKFSMTSGTSGVYVNQAGVGRNGNLTNPRQINYTMYPENIASANTVAVNNNNNSNPSANKSQVVDSDPFKGVSVSSFYPNPFYSNLNISLQAEHTGPVSVRIFDNYGKIVYSIQGSIEKGYSTIRLNNLGSLTQGIYYIKIITVDGTISTKIVK